jgi:hypothetical protein
MKFRRERGLLVTLISELECRLGGGERIRRGQWSSASQELQLSLDNRKLTRGFVNVGFRCDHVKSLAVVALPRQEWTLSRPARKTLLKIIGHRKNPLCKH